MKEVQDQFKKITNLENILLKRLERGLSLGLDYQEALQHIQIIENMKLSPTSIINDCIDIHEFYLKLPTKLTTIKLLKEFLPEIEESFDLAIQNLNTIFYDKNQKTVIGFNTLRKQLLIYQELITSFLYNIDSLKNKIDFLDFIIENTPEFIIELTEQNNIIKLELEKINNQILPIKEFIKLINDLMKVYNNSWFIATSDPETSKLLTEYSKINLLDKNITGQINGSALQVFHNLTNSHTSPNDIAEHNIKLIFKILDFKSIVNNTNINLRKNLNGI